MADNFNSAHRGNLDYPAYVRVHSIRTNDNLGSPSKVFDLLVEASKKHSVEGSAGGSYLTMPSKEGAIFVVINIVGNFGTVFCDNGYYNKAIAASPVDALPGYIMGGLSWFAIPWLAATTMGLSALALESNPVFPTYPNRIAPADVTAGLVLPTAAVALLGKGGAAAVLLLAFMAVTSAMSAELIAVSSIFTYDLYQTVSSYNSHDVLTLTTDFDIVLQPYHHRETAHLHVACHGHWLRNCDGGMVCWVALHRDQHGVPIPPHGRHHQLSCTSSHVDADGEQAELVGSNAKSTARLCLLPHRMAGDCSERRRRVHSRNHRCQ